MSLEIAETCKNICTENSVDYVFKASFDKANEHLFLVKEVLA